MIVRWSMLPCLRRILESNGESIELSACIPKAAAETIHEAQQYYMLYIPVCFRTL